MLNKLTQTKPLTNILLLYLSRSVILDLYTMWHAWLFLLRYFIIFLRSWQQAGVEVAVLSDDLSKEADVTALMKNASRFGPIEGVYVTMGDKQQDINENLLDTLDMVSRKLCPDIK